MQDGFIPRHGGYRNLKSYQKALIVYGATLHFAKRWVRAGSRTRDQMEQAARSGKQNIVEGSVASATSKETELRLTNVARASLKELVEDYEDFLRENRRSIWDKTHPCARRITALARAGGETYATYRNGIEHTDPEVAANVIRHLALQAVVLLTAQLQRLEADFLRNGGLREAMMRARCRARSRQEREVPGG